MNKSAPSDIDDYISGFPGPVHKKLREMRALIKKAELKARKKQGGYATSPVQS